CSCDTISPTALSTLSLHDALPISTSGCCAARRSAPLEAITRARAACFTEYAPRERSRQPHCSVARTRRRSRARPGRGPSARRPRSEEHTSELQSLRHLVCRLLLEK